MSTRTIGKLRGTWRLFDSAGIPMRAATELEVELFSRMDGLQQSADCYKGLYETSERLMVRAKYNYEGLSLAHQRVVTALDATEAERDELRAEVAAMRRDAERFRWIRERGSASWTILETGELAKCELFDIAIDAAMEANQCPADTAGDTPGA